MLKTYLFSVHFFCFPGRRMLACPSEDGRTITGKASSIPVSGCTSQLRPACAAASRQEEAFTHFLRPVHWPGPFQAGQGYSGLYRASSQHPLTRPLSLMLLGSASELIWLGPHAISSLILGIFAQLSDHRGQSPPQTLSVSHPLYLRLRFRKRSPSS